MSAIRSARIGDAPKVASLTAQLGYDVSEERTLELLAYLIRDDDHDVLVFDQDVVVGWAGLSIVHSLTSDPYVELIGLVVDENHRSAGIGAQLMAAAEDWARTRGYSKLRLRTNLVRTDTHRFYERIGYSRVKEQRVYEKALD